MINTKYLKLLRSNHRFDKNNFIYKTIAERITDSLDLLKIDVNQILEFGINENIVSNYFQKKYKEVDIDKADLCRSKISVISDFNFLNIDLNNLEIKNDFYDIIYSNFFIHLVPNFEDILKVILNSLKPNGFFIATIPDKDCSFQLLNSIYENDFNFYNGAYQRTNPTILIDNIFPILKKLNFDIPTIHSDKISIEYLKFENLINDVKKMNLSYCYHDKKQTFENKNYIKNLNKIYKEKYFDGNYNLDIKLNIISAWKKSSN